MNPNQPQKQPFIQAFDYSEFKSQDLVIKAQETLSNFLGFVRQTFDGLIEIGQELQHIYDCCLASCSDGKKVFKQWLDSKNFGASSYIAKSAMQLYNWFKDLNPRIQRLIRENVQDWKVSALRHLKHLTDELLEVVVTSGKKTAAQVKAISGRVSQTQAPKKITSQVNHSVENSTDTTMFTAAEVEIMKAEAIKQYKSEKAEEEQGKFVEIRDAALLSAEKEIIAYEQHIQNMKLKVSKLTEQLNTKEREIEQLQSLRLENQHLSQRVAELENALEDALLRRWDNTFTTQAAKVLNSQIENTVAPLMSEVERLQNLVQQKDNELAQIHKLSTEHEEQLMVLQQTLHTESDSIISTLGEVAENLGWNGWRRSGYRAQNGTLHKGISALKAFVSDLMHEYQYQLETVF